MRAKKSNSVLFLKRSLKVHWRRGNFLFLTDLVSLAAVFFALPSNGGGEGGGRGGAGRGSLLFSLREVAKNEYDIG